MFIIEFERTKRIVDGSTSPAPGILISIRQSIFGEPTKTSLLAERFLDGRQPEFHLEEDQDYTALILQEGPPPERSK